MVKACRKFTKDPPQPAAASSHAVEDMLLVVDSVTSVVDVRVRKVKMVAAA